MFFSSEGDGYYGHAALTGLIDYSRGNIYFYGHSNPRNGNAKKYGLKEYFQEHKKGKVMIIKLR